jgi:hypothetical protein
MKARGITFSQEPNEMHWGPFAAILDSEGFHKCESLSVAPDLLCRQRRDQAQDAVVKLHP